MEVRVGDAAIAYEEHGDGTPLLLLHAFPLNRRMWQPQVEGLRGVCRLILPDFRGFGETKPSPVESIDDYARDAAALLDHLGIQRAVVGGLSMGGYVTMAFARLYPERVRGLVLADTKGGEDTDAAKAAREATAQLAEREGVEAVAVQMLPRLANPDDPAQAGLRQQLRDLMAAATPQGIAAASRAMARREDAFEVLWRLDPPALLLVGALDEITPLEEAARLAQVMPKAVLKEIPYAGHISNLEQPDLFNDAVRAFLQRLPPE